MLTIKEKSIEGIPGFAIFLDSVRVDQFVKNFEVSLHSDGSIGSASMEMIYVPDFYKIQKTDPTTGLNISIEDGIENMTNIKIFIKNMFNDKYVMVFDGNIKGKSLSKNPHGYTLYFTANDYMTWLNKTIVPIAIPFNKTINPGDTLKWLAQGIDVEKVPTVSSGSEGLFRGKTLTEFIQTMERTTLLLNKTYSNTDTVAFWDNVIDRIKLMGDISKELIQNKVIDFVVTSSATFVNSMYVGINDIVKNLMFEFYQDRDGAIRIKPPYWNDKVLYDHIIEPLLITSYTESTNWNNYFTRIVVTGGVEESQEELNEFEKTMVTPAGAFIGSSSPDANIWSDYMSGNTGATVTPLSSSAGTGTYLDAYVILSPFWEWRTGTKKGDYHHGGTDFTMPMGSPIYHLGGTGICHNLDNDPGGFGTYCMVELISGPYKGCLVYYGHMNGWAQQNGAVVSNGDVIGYSGDSGNAKGGTPHLHLEIRNSNNDSKNPKDPLIYAKSTVGGSASTTTINAVGNRRLLEPSPEEKKYGISIYDTVQPLIKFSNSQVMVQDNHGRGALEKYAKFMYSLLNSMTEVASLQTVAMPWARPGFNVWIDPIGIDKVFYVNSITHQGSAEGGVFTSYNLSMGRARSQYANGGISFGSMQSQSDNIFINQFYQTVSDFGKVVASADEFDSIRKKCLDFYNNKDIQVIKSNQSPYFKEFYGSINFDAKLASGSQSLVSAVVATTSAATSEFHYDSWPQLMMVGTQGLYVTELQKALKKAGTYSESYFDQDFGNITRKAVEGFQKQTGLEVDGKVGKFTRTKLKELTDQTSVASSTTVSPATSANKLTVGEFCKDYTIDEIQENLSKIYAKGPAVVKDRAAKLNIIIENAKKYVSLHYVTEYFK